MTGNASPARRRSVTLAGKEKVATDTYLLRFELPPGDSIHTVAGQYVTFLLERNGKSVTRSYSITSEPGSHAAFELVIKKVAGGFASNLLCDAPLGTAFTVLAPLGKFVVHDPGGRSALFVATGTGIAPFFPMVQALHRDRPQTDTTLVVGYRYPADIILNERWMRLSEAWPRFHLVNVLSRPDPEWAVKPRHVQEALRERFRDLSNFDVYICGAPEMVSDVQDLSVQLGASKDRIFVERY